MSLILRSSLATNAKDKRIMEGQYVELNALRGKSVDDVQEMLNMTGNAARTPAEAYREFDSTTKIEQAPRGEHALLTRMLQVARPVNIGKEVFEYRKASDAGQGQTSMSGQIGVKLDHVDYKYGGTVVPVHDIGFGRRWREVESMRAEGFDALVDDSRETERQLLTVIGNYLWGGDANVSLKGNTWLGLRNDPTVASATLGVDLAATASTPTAIRDEVRRVRDILLIANNCSGGITLTISREIASNWERVFSTAEGTFGTIMDMIMKLRGIEEIVEDSELVGNQLSMIYISQQGMHPVVGMGMSTYAVPRTNHKLKVKITHPKVYGFDSKHLAQGEHELDEKLATKLVKTNKAALISPAKAPTK